MDLKLSGKTFLVTGASEGLGAALSRRLAEEGARLALCARRPEALEALKASLRAQGTEVFALPADVTDAAQAAHFVEKASSHFGALDGVVNNAGAASAGAFESLDDATWQADWNLKVIGAARILRLALPALRRSAGASVVNVLAIGAKAPNAKSLPSTASRAAGMAMNKALSKEWGPLSIRVNAVLVGLIESAQWERRSAAEGIAPSQLYAKMAKDASIPMGRFGRADEFADVVAFLLSERSSYLTGAAIPLDGGLSPSL
ncbi:MAG: SDR family NAD(P)-dependent oxidoreductase [Myxococcaceae bacterium]